MVSYIPTQTFSFCFEHVDTRCCTCANIAFWKHPFLWCAHTLFTCVEPRHSSRETLSQTGQRNEENTGVKMSEKSKSPKFVSPFKFQGTCLQSYRTNNYTFLQTACCNVEFICVQNLQIFGSVTRKALQAPIGHRLPNQLPLTWLPHQISTVDWLNIKPR